MRLIKCYICGETKKEIEFDYIFFEKKYKSECKNCSKKIAYHNL